jgi:hypothetical protein
MLMALQFQGFKQDEVLGFFAQGTGETHFRSKLDKHCFVSFDYRERGSSSDLNQVVVTSVQSFHPYSRKLNGARSEVGLESRPITRVYAWGSCGFAKRIQRHLSQRWCRFRIYVPYMFPPIVISFFRELYRAGYDLIKSIILKLIYNTTRQEAEFKKNSFKEDQKCH